MAKQLTGTAMRDSIDSGATLKADAHATQCRAQLAGD
jgi:hypothetical protein